MISRKTFIAALLAGTMLSGCNDGDDNGNSRKNSQLESTFDTALKDVKAQAETDRQALAKLRQDIDAEAQRRADGDAQALALLADLKTTVDALEANKTASANRNDDLDKKLDDLAGELDKAKQTLDASSKLDTHDTRLKALEDAKKTLDDKAGFDASAKEAQDDAIRDLQDRIPALADKAAVQTLQELIDQLTESSNNEANAREQQNAAFRERIAELERVVDKLTTPQQALAGYVNTTRGSAESNTIAKGNTFPATAMPFGFNMWSPVNMGEDNVFYEATQGKTMGGFIVTHEASKWNGNHQAMTMRPTTNVSSPSNQPFQRNNETAKAHYYSVIYDDGMRTEITPTDHAAYFRITAPATSEKTGITFGTYNGSLKFDKEKGTASGFTNHVADPMTPRMYVFIRFDNRITNSQNNSFVEFDTPAGAKTIGMRVATSFISEAQAEDNLNQEIAGKSFDDVLKLAEAAWNDRLNTIQVEGASEDQKIILYSNMYRAFLYPNSAWENVKRTDGTYEAQYSSPYTDTDKIKKGKIWVHNGFWDTYRTTWPLYTLLNPKEAGGMLDGFVNGYKDGGWTTRWSNPGYRDSMVATSLDVILADAYMKGVRNFDIDAAYKSMLRNATAYSDKNDRGRKGMEKSVFYGYKPTGVSGGEAVAWSLEAYLNDFGIAQMARALKKDDDIAYFDNRAISYANIFDGTSTGTWAGGWFRGKGQQGEWDDAMEWWATAGPNTWGCNYTEGNAWSYAFLAPQDGQGLANLYGGRSGLKAKLDAFFAAAPSSDGGCYGYDLHEAKEAREANRLANVGQYQHSNQTVHHSIYMYNYAGSPSSGQKHLRSVMDKLYFTGFDANGVSNGEGYIGDEDNGEQSAWYILSAMGIYPVSMGRPEYAIGAPYFKQMIVRLKDNEGKTRLLTIKAPNAGSGNPYVQAVRLNGKPVTRNYLLHSEVAAGGTLEFDMGPNPSQWGTGADDVPTSITKATAKPSPLVSLLPTANYDVTASTPANLTRAFDRDSGTAWSSPAGAEPWIEAGLKPSRTSSVVKLYTLTSAAGDGQDPKAWTLKGSNDGTTWETLDERKDETFLWRRQTRPFAIKTPAAWSRYRLEFAGTEAIAVPEFELLGE